MKLYVIKQLGFGAIFKSESKETAIGEYNKKTNNGVYCGFSIHEIDISESFFNSGINLVDGWRYIAQLCTFDNEIKINE